MKICINSPIKKKKKKKKQWNLLLIDFAYKVLVNIDRKKERDFKISNWSFSLLSIDLS